MTVAGPAQTPCQFLKAGATAVFSEECVKLLADAGYKPNWFGSYNHVNALLKGPRAAVAKYMAKVKAGTATEADKPTGDEWYLGNCQSGHLAQNAIFQPKDPENENSGRGDPCSNVPGVPGYDEDWYPCMPQFGAASDPNGEHGLATRHEQDCASAVGVPGTPYTKEQLDLDCAERAKLVAQNGSLAVECGRNYTGPPGKEGAEAGGGAGSGGDASGAGSVSPTKPNAPSTGWKAPAEGKTPGDCIESFRKAGVQAMQDRCADPKERAKNWSRANPDGDKDGGVDYRARLQKAAKDARERADKDPDNPEAQKAASRAQSNATAAQRASCRAVQGDQIANGNYGSGGGVVPPNPKF
jgi:hypothetical protein